MVPPWVSATPDNLVEAIDPANMALVTFKAPMAVAKDPTPDPVTSPVRVMV